MTSCSDAELLQRWRTGDAGAGDELFARHFTSVYRFFAAQVRDDVDDLTQRTFEACVVGRDRIKDDAAFRGYLFGIARKRLAAYLGERPQSGARVPLSEAELERLQSSPSGAFARADQQRLLLQAIAALPEELRATVELFYLESRTLLQIAERLAVPVGTVKSRLFRGRTMLREAFAQSDVAHPLKHASIAALDEASQTLDE